MIKIKLHDITDKDILKNIYTNIDCFNLYSMVNIIFMLEFKEGIYDLDKGVFAHLFYLENIERFSNEELGRIVKNLSNNVLVYKGEENKYLEEMSNEYNVLLINEKELDLDKVCPECINSDIIEVVKEILEYDSNVKYKPSDFLIAFDIYNNGDVYYNNQIVGNLKTELLTSIIFKADVNNIIKDYYTDYMKYSDFVFSEKLPTRYSLMVRDYNIKDVLDFKVKVFNMLKDIKPQDYSKLPEEFTDLLSNSGYIRMEDILEIIRR